MDKMIQECPLCETKLKVIAQSNDDLPQIECMRCGVFRISSDLFGKLDERQRTQLAGFTKESGDLNARSPVITAENLDDLLAAVPQRIPDKAIRLLAAISRRTTFFGEIVTLHRRSDDVPLAYARHKDEFGHFVEYLVGLEFIKQLAWTGDTVDVVLTALGFETLESRDAVGLESDSAFVAMSFGDTLREAMSEGIRPAIEDDCGFRAIRGDLEEHNDDVIDRVLAEIRKARFVVADFTHHRNGVYFEAGYALGLSIPVIWLCREDDRDNAHFDTEHFNHIYWSDPQELRRRLALRIQATIGFGPGPRDI